MYTDLLSGTCVGACQHLQVVGISQGPALVLCHDNMLCIKYPNVIIVWDD